MKKYSLQFELILKISIGFILLIIILSSSIVMFTSGQYNRIIMENIHGSMENAVNSIDYYFEDVKTPMVMLARNKNIREVMKNYTNMSNREKFNSTNAVEDFVQNITTFKSFINDIIIVGSQGFQYNIYNENADKFLRDFDFTGEDYFRKIEEGTVRLYYVGEHATEYYMHPPRNETVYSVILPVRSMQSRIGYIICDIKSDMINEILDHNLKDDKAKILILDEEGMLICERGNTQISAEELMADGLYENAEEQPANFLQILFARDNYITQVHSQVTGWTYVYAEPYDNFNGFVRKIFWFDFCVIVIGMIVIIFFSRQLSGQILKPLKNIAFMIREMKISQQSDQRGTFYSESRNVKELSIEIEHMIQRIDRLINENYLYELRSRDAQIQTLINQLSPHFLYNTLQLIEYPSLANNQENVTRIINELNYILRYSMKTVKTVELWEELNYVRAYLDIYQLRYQDKMQYEILEKDRLSKIMIPKMVLEPLVENCIKHGFAGNFNHALIAVTVEVCEKNLRICVRDNGRGMSSEKLRRVRNSLQKAESMGEHIGLNNVNLILKLRYGGEFGVWMDSVEGEFTETTLLLPIEQQSGVTLS